jgi:hypothetical protein
MSRRVGTALAKLNLRRHVGSISRKWIIGSHRAAKPGEASLVPAARAKLRELNLELPSPFSAEALCARVSEQRGRPILIQEVPALDADTPCSLWIETTDADHFLVARGATKSHREHIVLHELAHVLYDHQGVLGESHLHLSMPNLSPTLIARMLPHGHAPKEAGETPFRQRPVIKRVLGRGSYGPHEEQVAETWASVLMEQVNREQERRADGHDREVLVNLSRMFE